MRTTKSLAVVLLCCGVAFVPRHVNGQAADEVKEVTLVAPNRVAVRVRMQAPYDAETPLQVVCYFKHKAAGDNNLIPEMYVSRLNEEFPGPIGAPAGSIPMVGYGAGSFILCLMERRPGAVDTVIA